MNSFSSNSYDWICSAGKFVGLKCSRWLSESPRRSGWNRGRVYAKEKKNEWKKKRETNAEYDFCNWPSDILIRDTNIDVYDTQITCITHKIYRVLQSKSACVLSTIQTFIPKEFELEGLDIVLSNFKLFIIKLFWYFKILLQLKREKNTRLVIIKDLLYHYLII